jgi:hypothetical protein
MIFTASGAAAKDACLRYAPARTTVAGQVYSFTAYGPPGYGADPDHDAPESYLGLTMLSPICVKGNGPTELHVGVIELAAPAGFVPAALLGKEVRVTGRLVHATDEHAHADVIMRAPKLQVVKAAK